MGLGIRLGIGMGMELGHWPGDGYLTSNGTGNMAGAGHWVMTTEGNTDG